MPKRDSTRWWYAAEAALGVACISLPLSLGGAPAWTTALLLGLSSVALISWLVGAWRHRRRAAWHPFLWLPAGVAVVAGLSLIPLPAAVHGLVSPIGAELREFALGPLGLDSARPLTMDAPSTWRALVRALSFFSLGLVALQLGRVPGARLRLMLAIVLTGGVVAIVGFGHLVAGAESLFGVVHFVANLPLLTFFGNTNHLAAFLAFCGTVALGLSLEARNKEAAFGLAVVALTCGTGVFLSFSRGGIATFAVTWGLVGAFWLSRRQGGVTVALPWLVIGATALFALSLASEQIFERLASVATVEKLSKSKLELWPMFWSGALEYGRAGMGLGAFELGFSRFQTRQLDVTFTHPENIGLQWLAELGVPLTLCLGAMVAFVAWRLVRQARGATLEPVLLMAVFGALLHDAFDFALELNALPAVVFVVLGLCAARESEVEPEPLRHPVRRRAVFAAAALAVVGLLAIWRGLLTHGRAEEQLLVQVKQGARSEAVRQAAIQAIDRHPADWVFYSVVAQRLSEEGAARESLAWVNRVLFLRPQDSRAHVSAARALLRLNLSTQALLEFNVARRLGDSSSYDEGLLLAAKLGAFDQLLDETPGQLSRACERYRVLGRLDAAEALLETVEQLPPSQAVLEEAAVLRVSQSQARGDIDDAVKRLDVLPSETRARPELVLLSASLLARLGRLDEAVAKLDALARKTPEDTGVSTMLAQLLAQQQRTTEARAVLDRARPFVSGPLARSQLFQREADLWVQDERWPRALEALQTASRIEPTRADLKYRMAQIYERMGSLHSALDEVRRGRLLDTPEGAKAQDAWLGRLEAALTSRGIE